MDHTALKIALETDLRYDAAVTGGRNRELLVLLGEDEAGKETTLIPSSEDVIAAIGDGVRVLTVDQLGILQLYTSRDTVSVDGLTEIRELFTGNVRALASIDGVTKRTATYGEAFGGQVSLQDLWIVLPDIAKSRQAMRKVEDDTKAVANETTIVGLQATIQTLNPELTQSSARSQAIRQMYDEGKQA